MAALLTGREHGLDLSRAALRKYRGIGHPMYPWDAVRAIDVVGDRDEFLGPSINTFLWTTGNGGGASAASPAISAGKVGGQISLVTGTAGDNTASSIIVGGRNFYGQNNAVITACLDITSVVTSVKVEIGFKDNILTSAGNGAVVNGKAANTFIATDGVCWIYDSADSGRGWDGMGVANTTAATRMTSYNTVPVASTFEYFQIALVDTVAYFSHYTAAGVRDFGPTAMTAAITKDVLVAPYIYIEAKNATSKTAFVDMIEVYEGRTTD